MPEMTSEQFKTLLDHLSLRQQDHDTLVEIKTIVKMNAEAFSLHKEEMGVRIAEAKTAAKAAHERLDNEVKARWMFAGAISLVSIIGVITGIIMAILR